MGASNAGESRGARGSIMRLVPDQKVQRRRSNRPACLRASIAAKRFKAGRRSGRILFDQLIADNERMH